MERDGDGDGVDVYTITLGRSYTMDVPSFNLETSNNNVPYTHLMKAIASSACTGDVDNFYSR